MYFQAMVGKLGSRLVAFSRLRSYSTVPTIHDVRQGLQKLTAFDPNFGDRKAKKADNQAVSSQAELKAERMNESYVEAVIPLGDRPELRNKYSNFLKGVRFGRLLEDLDTMAGKCSVDFGCKGVNSLLFFLVKESKVNQRINGQMKRKIKVTLDKRTLKESNEK